MMTYRAPDGHLIETKPYPEVVVYQCNCVDFVDGVYESSETMAGDGPLGIQQMRITRTVENNFMTISVRESSYDELLEYIQTISSNSDSNISESDGDIIDSTNNE